MRQQSKKTNTQENDRAAGRKDHNNCARAIYMTDIFNLYSVLLDK